MNVTSDVAGCGAAPTQLVVVLSGEIFPVALPDEVSLVGRRGRGVATAMGTVADVGIVAGSAHALAAGSFAASFGVYAFPLVIKSGRGRGVAMLIDSPSKVER